MCTYSLKNRDHDYQCHLMSPVVVGRRGPKGEFEASNSCPSIRALQFKDGANIILTVRNDDKGV